MSCHKTKLLSVFCDAQIWILEILNRVMPDKWKRKMIFNQQSSSSEVIEMVSMKVFM